MRKIKTNCNKTKLNLFFKLIFCFAFALILTGFRTDKVMAAGKKLYLSDINNDVARTKIASGHILKKDGNDSDKIIVLKTGENETRSFVKGITAWATSEVVYDLNEYRDYDFFTAYIGIDISEQSNYYNTGAKFKVYTSDDATNWTEKYVSPNAFYGWSVTEQIKVPLDGARYLKLVTDSNSNSWWAEWYDETVFADAKLITEDYEDTGVVEKVDFINTVDEYDKKLREFESAGDMSSEDYELTLLQREFVNNFGYDVLVDFVNCRDDYKDTVHWLMTDLTNMRLYIYGGEPDGNYIASMQALNSVYQAHKADLEDKSQTKAGVTTYGELYRKMMITVSLTHSAQVALWMQTDTPENQSTAIDRYEIFKDLHKNDGFVAYNDGETVVDYTPLYESLEVEELRFVLNNIIDDQSIYWLNDYVHNRIKEHPTEIGKYLTPHPYMKYITPNYANPEFHKAENYQKWDDKYEGVFSKYKIPYRDGLYKLWMNIEGGAVCGGISKIGSNIRGVNGIPSSVISQPGHAALIYYSQDSEGNGYWNIDNDVSGWPQSGKTERLSLRNPLGWGDDDYAEGWLASYVPLAQDAINNFDDYTASMRYVYLANSFASDPNKQTELYRKALEILPINIDAWYGIIKIYEADPNTTNDQYLSLAEEIGNSLKCYPLPMYNLTNRIKKQFTSDEPTYNFKFTLFQTSILTTGSTWANKEKTRPAKGSVSAEEYYTNWVYQPGITQSVSKFLLGQTDTELAKFSFDEIKTTVGEGENAEEKVEEAGVLKLSSRFDGSGVRWDYTLKGKSTSKDDYIEVTNSNEVKLTDEQIASITADNDIYVHIIGTGSATDGSLPYSEDTLYKIDITDQTLSPNLYANDYENSVIGIDKKITEWRYVQKESEIATVSADDGWTLFENESPNLRGDVSIEVRQIATGTKLASVPTKYDFTSNGENDYTKNYVGISHLSIDDVSTEEPGHDGAASKAIDGNYNTRYHSNWNGKDTERYMVIKVDRPIYLSAVEFVPGGGGNGKIVNGTVYGKLNKEDEWIELSKATGWSYTSDVNAPDFGLRNIKTFTVEDPQEVQYIMIKADQTNGNWFAARMFNIFQDLTKNPHPTACIEFSTTEPTTGEVVAKLTNFNVDIKNIEMISGNDSVENIDISEDGMTATFKENGLYTFKFKFKDINLEGLKEGSAEAHVTWIDKVAPKATIEYSTTSLTNGEVVATLVPDEEIIVTNNPHTEYNETGKLYTFSQNGEFTFEYEDLAGNKGEPVTAKVNWINSASGDMIADGPELDENQSGQEAPGIEENPGTGDNQDPSTGETPGTGGSQTPGTEETPGTGGSQTPGTEETPGTGESQNPGTEETPGTGESQTPGTEGTPGTSESQNPGTEETPGTGEGQTPGTGETPGTSEGQNPGTGETPGTSEGQNPGTEQKPGTGETQKPSGEQTPGTSENQKPNDGNTTVQGDENKDNNNNTTTKPDNQKPSNGNITGKPDNKKPESGSSSQVDDTKANGKLPNTGKKTILITAISVASIWGVISYIRYINLGKKKYRNHK